MSQSEPAGVFPPARLKYQRYQGLMVQVRHANAGRPAAEQRVSDPGGPLEESPPTN